MYRARVSLLLLATFAACSGGCRAKPAGSGETSGRLQPVYDKATGRLTMLTYDSRKRGKIDTWTYMDGPRIVRIEIDGDGDGIVDRWEYYDARQTLEKVGLSRANDGTPDAWAYAAPDGSLARLEISTAQNGKVTRTEFYDHDVITRAEEDTDGDGRIDKWETYRDGAVSMVAFDTTHRGTPDRRLIYQPDGRVRAEVDPTGSGQFVPAK